MIGLVGGKQERIHIWRFPMDAQVLVDQQKLTFISSVRKLSAVAKIY